MAFALTLAPPCVKTTLCFLSPAKEDKDHDGIGYDTVTTLKNIGDGAFKVLIARIYDDWSISVAITGANFNLHSTLQHF
jgi:hypothetical protein